MPEVDDFLPLSAPNYYILASLMSGPKHGYAILKEVESLSEGEVRPAIGNLYVGLQRLSDQGLIFHVEEPHPIAPKRRKTYQLSPLGESVLRAQAERLRRMLQVAPAGFQSSTSHVSDMQRF